LIRASPICIHHRINYFINFAKLIFQLKVYWLYYIIKIMKFSLWSRRGIQDYVIANTVYFVVAIPHTHARYIFLKSFSDQRNR
jgi:hypothetical protein